MAFIDELKNSHMDMLEAIQGFSPDELSKENAIGYWSVRDTILHITMWEGEVLKALSVIRTGQEYDWSYTKDYQMFNEFFIEAGRHLPTGSVLQMFNLTHSALISDMVLMNDAFSEENGGIPKWLSVLTVDHIKHHSQKIKEYKETLVKKL